VFTNEERFTCYKEGAAERQLAKTQQIGGGVIQGFTLVLGGPGHDNKGEGIFAWAPLLREWLKDSDYVFWLGAGGLRIGI
jgi:hypothetical protein